MEVILLLCFAETPAMDTSAQEKQGHVGASPEEATQMIRGLEPLCEARLRVEVVQLREEKAPGRPSCSLLVLKGAIRKAGTDFLVGSVVTGQEEKDLN